ncbi:MAG: FAD binding domain-containing protein [Vulcanimicrobiaceae bacterium]
MRPFTYARASDAQDAVRVARSQSDGDVYYLAGGTTLVDLAKLQVLAPHTIVDLSPLAAQYGAIESGSDGLRLGGLVKMAAAARHPSIVASYPLIAQALRLAASPQLRNMATLAGNVLQRTRCPYYRDVSWTACNKRTPGSGCAAIGGITRRHAILGTSEHCIAAYAGDFAHALVALGASVEIVGAGGTRTIEFEALHREPGERPDIETTLEPGDVIVGFFVPAGPWTHRSHFVKVRDRESFEFALASAAVALDLADGVVREARIALGGVTAKPRRAREAEAVLRGKKLDERAAEAAADAAFAETRTFEDNTFKVELGRQTLVRALLEAARL